MFELTGEYTIILPLMLAIVLATLVSRMLTCDTIYTLKLRRRGIDLDAHHAAHPLSGRRVRTAMEPVPRLLPDTTSLEQAALMLALSDHGVLPVTNGAGVYQGVVTARAVAEALTDQEPDDNADHDQTPGTIADLTEMPAPVTADALAQRSAAPAHRCPRHRSAGPGRLQDPPHRLDHPPNRADRAATTTGDASNSRPTYSTRTRRPMAGGRPHMRPVPFKELFTANPTAADLAHDLRYALNS